MPKKIIGFLVAILLVATSILPSFADAPKTGKVIVIGMNRTSLEDFKEIEFLNLKLDETGDLGMMNIRGDKGYDDKRNFASIGATGRADIKEVPLAFREVNDINKEIYKSATGYEPGKINLLNINEIDSYNQEKGDFKSKLGALADSLIEEGKKVAAVGNSDYYDSYGRKLSNKNFALSAMDSKGRIFYGKVDGLNKQDTTLPYGIATDYEKLFAETQKAYKEADLVFIDLGDTFRLDEYKSELNEVTYEKMRTEIYTRASDYMEKVFKMASKKDTIYITGGFPSNLEYSQNKRLAPVVRFEDKAEKGILKSSTTRREGILGNIDLGVDILSRFGIENKAMVGRNLVSKPMEENFEFLQNEYKKIVSISSIRMSIINIYVSFISISWCMAALALWQRKKLPSKYRNKILCLLKELVKFGLIMPLAFLSAPLLGVDSELGIALAIILISIIYYVAGKRAFKGDDIKQIGFYSAVMILLITIDSITGTPLMQSNIMSYDPMIGARYYGIGNEYEGVTIGSAILAGAVLLEGKKIGKATLAVLLLIVLLTSASPQQGANVGGAISESIAYLSFVLMIYDVKIDFKKIIMIILSAGALVGVFAALDLMLGLGSHLGNFVQKIMINGPMEIVNVFIRKIEMNIHLAQTTVWVHILIVGLLILAITIFRPNKNFAIMKKEHKYIYKGFLATIVGCLVTLLVNDSGIIAAATDSIYLLIPIIILLINKKIEEKRKIC